MSGGDWLRLVLLPTLAGAALGFVIEQMTRPRRHVGPAFDQLAAALDAQQRARGDVMAAVASMEREANRQRVRLILLWSAAALLVAASGRGHRRDTPNAH